jgi:hypothetical protein
MKFSLAVLAILALLTLTSLGWIWLIHTANRL